MFRLVMITVVVSVSVLHCTQADAQLLFGRRHQSARGAQLQRYDTSRQTEQDRTYRSYRPSSGLDIRIGIGSYPGYGYYSGFGAYGYLDPYRFDGYGYDPYRYGSFEAPDLLKDPYFRERYRYDSKFPSIRVILFNCTQEIKNRSESGMHCMLFKMSMRWIGSVPDQVSKSRQSTAIE